MGNKIVQVEAILDDTNGNLVSLKQQGIPGKVIDPGGGFSAVTKVANVSPDVNKDIPAADLRTALGLPFTVAGVAASGGAWGSADVVKGNASSGLIQALGLPIKVANISPDVNLDIPVATLSPAIATQTALDVAITWANLAITPGTYAGQRKRLPSLDGLGGYVYVVWNATKAAWEPDGVQTLASLKRIAGASSTTSSVTIPSITIPGGPFWKETTIDIILELTSTVNGCTAAPVQMSLGAMTLINDTTQPSRAKRFSRPVRIQDTAVQFCHARGDNQYSSFTNLTAGALQGTVNTAADMTLSAGVDTGWVNASAHVLSMEMYEVLWRR